MVGALKFGRASAAAVVIAESIADVLPPLREIVIVPIPTATARIRQRGYDQATLIARELARTTEALYAPVMARLGQSRQVGANRQQRLEQLRSAYSVVRPRRIIGRDVLLVDDVLTTGATIENAARVLLRAGARSVSAVVFTQKDSDKPA